VTTAADADLTALTVAPGERVGVAWERLRAGGVGLAVVAGADGRVVGTLTDGSVRRAAVSASLDTPVTTVLSRRPLLAPASAADGEIEALLRDERVPAVAVVDDGRLVGVRTVAEFPTARPPTPVAVVMVGGRGERLRPLTDKLPKPLLRIGPSSIVERLVAALGRAGVDDVFLSVRYLAEEFEERLGDGSALGVRLHYLHEEEVLGTAGGLTLLPGRPTGPVLVTNGDLVTTVDFASLLDFHWHHAGAITVCAVEHLTGVPYGVLRTAEHHLLSIDEKPSRRDLINAGMYVLEPEVLRFLTPGEETGMPDLIADVIAEGLPVHVFPVLERWFDIGSPEEFEKVLLAFATGEAE
jgi:dTDP-glucose pyrophosphorylase